MLDRFHKYDIYYSALPCRDCITLPKSPVKWPWCCSCVVHMNVSTWRIRLGHWYLWLAFLGDFRFFTGHYFGDLWFWRILTLRFFFVYLSLLSAWCFICMFWWSATFQGVISLGLALVSIIGYIYIYIFEKGLRSCVMWVDAFVLQLRHYINNHQPLICFWGGLLWRYLLLRIWSEFAPIKYPLTLCIFAECLILEIFLSV